MEEENNNVSIEAVLKVFEEIKTVLDNHANCIKKLDQRIAVLEDNMATLLGQSEIESEEEDLLD